MRDDTAAVEPGPAEVAATADARGGRVAIDDALLRAVAAAPARRPPVKLSFGDVVADRFRLQHEVARGGMGRIVRADDLVTGDAVAVKLLRADASEEERFLREAQLLASLGHPHIVRHVAHGRTSDNQLFLAMEWLEGQDLAQRLAAGALTVHAATELGSRVARALAVAHAAGVVHRDIKPSNIFLPGGVVERVKVLDFGIARVIDEGPATQTGHVLGTPGYMAPEQARGDRQIDARSDVFALGCVLFECLTGRPVFVAERVLALLAKVLFEDAPRLSTIAPALPAGLDALVADMLAKDPADRPADGAVVAARLDALAEQLVGNVSIAVPRPATIMTAEQRRLFVVFAALSSPDESHAARATLDRVGRDHGARVDWLADGSLVAIVAAHGSATDQATRAARCALALKQLAPHTTVVLTTGRARVGDSSSLGQVLDRGAALVASIQSHPVAAPLAVFVDIACAALLEARFELTAVEALADVRGLARERADGEEARLLLGRPTPFVGRTADVAATLGMFAECVEEARARPVLFSAPAGMGKTRLRHELVRRMRELAPDLVIWTATAELSRRSVALAVIGDLVRGALGVSASDARELAADARSALLADRLEQRFPAACTAEVALFVGELVGAGFADGAHPALQLAHADPITMVQRMTEACAALVTSATRTGPLVVVIDDLHWADSASLRLLDGLLRCGSEQPLFLLAFARSEIHEAEPRLWVDRAVREVRLAPLGRKASEAFVREVLGSETPAATIDDLCTRAAGHPFFVEELIRTVARGNTTALPETIETMLQARLGERDACERRVLRAASVFGERFWENAVVSVLAIGDGDTEARTETQVAIDRLCHDELIERSRSSRFAGERELVFRHALVREATYASLTDEDRPIGHARAAAWLERAGELDAAVLADHWDRGGDPARASARFGDAAWQAYRAGDSARTVALAGRAIALAPDLASTTLHRLLAAGLYAGGDTARAVEAAQHALAGARVGSSDWYRAVRVLFAPLCQIGDGRAFEALAKSVDGLQPTAETSAIHFQTMAQIAVELAHLGLLDRARAFSHRIDATPAAASRSRLAAWARLVHGWLALFAHDPWTAYAEGPPAVALFEQVGDLQLKVFAHLIHAWGAVRLGAWGKWRDELEAHRATGLSVRLFEPVWHFLSGYERMVCGSSDESVAAAERSVVITESLHNRMLIGACTSRLARALLAAGRPELARAQAMRAVIATESFQGHDVMAGTIDAATRLACGDAAGSLVVSTTTFERTEAGAATCDVDEWLYLVHAAALATNGDTEGMRATLRRGRERLRDYAAKIPDVTLRESFFAIPAHARILELADAETAGELLRGLPTAWS